MELVFDLERSGDGTSETWNSKANTDMTVNIWDASSNPNSTPGTSILLNNSDVDTFVIPESGSASTPNSVGIKLETVLDTIQKSVGTLPTAQPGDEFLLTVSFVNDDSSMDTLIAGDFILS